ncbi:amidase [Amycolatopsis sp. NPDC059021]|uniref:amidase n=1 Tax=Amycolatopsis sp. NPDC059021 TaxID=3346704 RepID=UPI00367305B7
MSQLWHQGAGELAGRIRTGEVSAHEVVTAHLERIEAVNPRLNAITDVLAEQALEAAKVVDRERKTGPLCGVPMTVKENIDIAGSATTHGVVAMREAIAREDAPHIGELRAAGAIPLGRTNMPEFGMRWHTDNALRGATRNPWSAGHTPGASSGGDAVAVATGMVPLGMGNDGAGSLRWPAQCCGVAALKPSLGRVGMAMRAPVPFAFQLLAVHGPIAREVRNLRLAFAHLCGPGADPWYAPVPLDGPPLPKHVALVTGDNVAAPIAEALWAAAAALTDAGYAVEEAEPPHLARASEIFIQIMLNHGRVHEGQTPVESIASADFVRFWAAFEPVWRHAAGTAAADPMAERATIARAWHDWMCRTPLVLAPIRTAPAFRVGEDLDPAWLADWPESMRAVVAVNLLGLPAVAVPVDATDGLPQAVQVIGPRFREDLCLDAAAAIEARAGRRTPIDPR